MRVRDPIHGTIVVSDEEKAVIDSRFYQRLRHVRQLGFGELAFPGATHTRHAHSLGAMHVASMLFDAVSEHRPLPARFRCAVRLAVLCHDLGHMPFSHASESIAPRRVLLELPAWLDPPGSVSPDRQASHEDYTARILLDSSLTPVIRERFERHGITPESVVSLIAGLPSPLGTEFVHEGVDYGPLLRAMVSGELDADRMDYLQRDSFYTGVSYGRYDLDWIVRNLVPAEKDGRAYLALSKAAAFAFEDFLLSRYHMFISVYLHHTSVNFDKMLRRYYEETPGEFEIPHDPEAFLLCDDVALNHVLRGSRNRWAARIVTRRGFKLAAQFTERDQGYDLVAMSEALTQAGVESFSVESESALSRYVNGVDDGSSPGLFILDMNNGRLTDVAKYMPLYRRYSGAVKLSRLYVRPDHQEAAEQVLRRLERG